MSTILLIVVALPFPPLDDRIRAAWRWAWERVT